MKTSVAVVQMRSSEDKQENLIRSVGSIKDAADKKAGMICFPEFQMAFSPSKQTASQLAKVAETVQGNFVSTLQRAAKKHDIEVVATIYEKSGGKRVYDTAVIIDKKGMLASIYRKLHLYNALGFKESKKLMPGKKMAEPAKTSAGRLGVMICYDVRFPEMSRLLTMRGANILVAPSGWVQGPMKEEQWQTMIKARALENGAYMVAPDQVGNIYAGRSMVVNPFGVVILDMGQREGMEVVELDMDKVDQVRKSLPLLKNRRTDIYRLVSSED